MKNRIVLVGFSGAGKSTIARKIAARFGFDVLDTDKMLEEKYHISVYDCFEKYGEETFRKLEYEILKKTLQQENVVIACGGGTPCYADAMQLINEAGFSIYIEMSQKSLVHRLLYTKVIRPLTKGKTEEELSEFVNKQLSFREPYYKQAHITVKGENFDLEEMIQKIIKN